MGLVFGSVNGADPGATLEFADASSGSVVARATTNSQMQYSVNLNPGTYNVELADGRSVSPASIRVPYAPQSQVFSIV